MSISSAHGPGKSLPFSEPSYTKTDHNQGVGILKSGISLTEQLFSESAARALISVNPAKIQRVTELATELNVPCKIIGVVGGSTLSISGTIDIQLAELKDLYFNSLRKRMTQS